ncbi:hypothetical protein Tco_0195244 [Tanacetum coccineum]
MFLQLQSELKDPRPKVSSMMASMDEDVEKTSLTDQDDVGSGVSSSGQNKSRKYRDSSGSKTFDSDSQTTEERSARYASTSHAERDTPSRSSRSGDRRRSRRDSPEYDRHQGRVVSRRHSDDRDYRNCSEPSPRHGRDYRDCNNKRSRYESSRRTPDLIGMTDDGNGKNHRVVIAVRIMKTCGNRFLFIHVVSERKGSNNTTIHVTIIIQTAMKKRDSGLKRGRKKEDATMDANWRRKETVIPSKSVNQEVEKPVEIASCSTIKRTDPLEPEETGDGGLQLPGKDQVIFRPSEKITISVIHFQFHLRTPTVSSIMASIDEDVEKSSLADQEDVRVRKSRFTKEERSARNGLYLHCEFQTRGKNDAELML